MHEVLMKFDETFCDLDDDCCTDVDRYAWDLRNTIERLEREAVKYRIIKAELAGVLWRIPPQERAKIEKMTGLTA